VGTLARLNAETVLTMKYYAHSLEGQPPDKWQPLEEHLQNVAEMAAEFVRPFGGEQWADLAEM
jgi:CRISPR-associated endonuclease/helicase Cas3